MICSSLWFLCIQLKLQLSESQSQLELAQKEAQAHKEELEQVHSLTNLSPPLYNNNDSLKSCDGYIYIKTCYLCNIVRNLWKSLFNLHSQLRKVSVTAKIGGYVITYQRRLPVFRSENSWKRSRCGVSKKRMAQLRLNPVRSGCKGHRAPFTSCQRVLDSERDLKTQKLIHVST